MLDKFSKNLREFAKEKGLSARQLAKEIGVTFSNVSKWMRGLIYPSIDKLIMLADYFKVSVNYLLGRIEFETDFKKHDRLPFPTLFNKLLKINNKTITEVSVNTNISTSLIYYWLNEKTLPSVESLIRLADFFGCSVDFLLGFER